MEVKKTGETHKPLPSIRNVISIHTCICIFIEGKKQRRSHLVNISDSEAQVATFTKRESAGDCLEQRTRQLC